MRHSKEAKIKALLNEGNEWEKGKRGTSSKAASKEERDALDQRLELAMISIRLPTAAVEQLKIRAAKNGIGYQPYIRQLVMEHLKEPSLEDRVARLEQKLHSKTG
ncbi:MAG: hypothetical protein KA715_10300 [Xanthomonadaceae bacterium]|nr:hypothetical protein [Xanthomonadaceae bacterium]